MAKETVKKQEVVFLHKENPFFLFTFGKIRCQFIDSKYTTSNELEIQILTDYMYNTNDIMIAR